LLKAESDFIVLPCNTLHDLLPILRKKFHCEFLDLIEETSKQIRENYSCVGILGTSKTKQKGLYDKNLKYVDVIYPSEKEQEKLSEIINRIISNNSNEKDKKFLNNLINKLQKRGAEKIVLACTDLGNIVKRDNRTIDSTEVLIHKTISKTKEYIFIN